jgi:hypothetical protein
MVLDTRVRAKKGSVFFRAPCSAREISEARLSPFRGAIREVAPIHARPRVRSARIGSFCRVVAAPVWVQAWVGAVGRVRNASPILGSLPLPKCGVPLCYSLSFDYVVFLVQSKSPAEDADHVAFSGNSLLAHGPRYCREGLRCRIWV